MCIIQIEVNCVVKISGGDPKEMRSDVSVFPIEYFGYVSELS